LTTFTHYRLVYCNRIVTVLANLSGSNNTVPQWSLKYFRSFLTLITLNAAGFRPTVDWLRDFAALYGMQTRSSDEKAVCLSVRPSIWQTRALCQNGRKICADFYTIRKNSQPSFL